MKVWEIVFYIIAGLLFAAFIGLIFWFTFNFYLLVIPLLIMWLLWKLIIFWGNHS